MKNENEQKARLANIQFLNRRSAQRGVESAEDSKLETSIAKDISKEMDARSGKQVGKGNTVSRVLINDAARIVKSPGVLELAESWYETAEYCEIAADFYDKRYGRSVEYYFRMKERAATIRDCISELLLSATGTNNENKGTK